MYVRNKIGSVKNLFVLYIYIYNIYFRGLLIERSVGKASMLGITHTTGLGLIAYAHNSALEAKNPSQVFEAYIFFNSIAI